LKIRLTLNFQFEKTVSLQRDLKYKNMTTVFIEDNSAQATSFVEYARTLPFTRVVAEKKMSFEEACAECNAVTVDYFFDELNSRIEKWADHA